MTELSRRYFLASWLPTLPACRKYQAERAAENWLEVGNIAEFPPGATRKVASHAGSPSVVVVSMAEGLFAYAEGSPSARRPIRLGRDGRILVNILGIWPENLVLSPMTGEAVELAPSEHAKKEDEA